MENSPTFYELDYKITSSEINESNKQVKIGEGCWFGQPAK